MVLPFENFIGNSVSEDELWLTFKKFLPNSFISFHNYHIGLKQVDVIVLVPDKGILIIENKGYLAKNIIDVPDNSTIRRIGNPPDFSPFLQANGYRNNLINELRKENINSVYIIPSVSYPYIGETEFADKKLGKICRREYAFLKEDLVSAETILKRISCIFDLGYNQIHAPGLEQNSFDQNLFERVGNIISPDFRNEVSSSETSASEGEDIPSYTPPESEPQILYTDNALYSELTYSNSRELLTDEYLSICVGKWLSGTKIQWYTSDELSYKTITDYFKNTIYSNDLKIINDSSESLMAFRLEIGYVREELTPFEILNGVIAPGQEKLLKQLDSLSAFNYGQFMMEHAPRDNILVKAGAGTGKTFSLISRINYLIWKDNIAPDDLKRYIALITFTNEAADQMKADLEKNFLNFYRLTSHVTGTKYLKYLESVQDVNIKTIDSLARLILSRYSAKLGLGKEFAITTGSYRRKELLRDNLNAFYTAHPEKKELAGMRMYYFEKRLSELMDKFDNKNIDIIHAFDSLNFGGGDKSLPDGIIEVLKETQKQLDIETHKNNTLCLGELIRELQYLATILKPEDIRADDKIKYLFIDEFQDTDYVQIELVKSFQRLMGFFYFVVGDVKQCIYRFRGAEANAFDQLIRDGKKPFVVALNKNYRSDRNLLDSMNAIFKAWDQSGDIEYSGDDVLSGTKDLSVSDSIHVIQTYQDGTFDEKAFAEILRKCTEEAQKSKEKTRGNVAILVRYNYEIAEIIRICHDYEIDVTTEVGGELFSVDPTIDLQKLLMALRYNREPEYLFNLYTTSFVRKPLPKAELFGKTKSQLVDYFYKNCPIPKWNDYISQLRTQPVLGVIQKIIKDTNPWENFARCTAKTKEENRQKRLYYLRNLDQLIENLLQIANSDYLTINKLVDYLDIMILTRQEANSREPFGMTDGTSNLICTTVHKSKGLQYDTVILPFCSFDISGSRSKGSVDVIYENGEVGYTLKDEKCKKIAFRNNIYEKYVKDENESRRKEETRILYVAMTRAERSLYYFAPPEEKAKKNLTWAKRLKEKVK